MLSVAGYANSRIGCGTGASCSVIRICSKRRRLTLSSSRLVISALSRSSSAIPRRRGLRRDVATAMMSGPKPLCHVLVRISSRSGSVHSGTEISVKRTERRPFNTVLEVRRARGYDKTAAKLVQFIIDILDDPRPVGLGLWLIPSMTTMSRGLPVAGQLRHCLSLLRHRSRLVSVIPSPVCLMSLEIRRSMTSFFPAVSVKSSGLMKTINGLCARASQLCATIQDFPLPSPPMMQTTVLSRVAVR